MSLRVADDAGRPVAPGQEGALMFRGPFLFAGYLQGRAFSEGHFNGEGYFDSGDIGYLDGDGYLRVTGRKKDLIIRGGENIPVREIEDLLMGRPAVPAVALVGVPDERLGERAVACFRPRPGRALSLDEVRSYLAGHSVTKQFWPEAVELFEELPMTPAGKVQKFHLRQALQAGRRTKGSNGSSAEPATPRSPSSNAGRRAKGSNGARSAIVGACRRRSAPLSLPITTSRTRTSASRP
jgi:cyclohexanecarboxylate-CoA ligase